MNQRTLLKKTMSLARAGNAEAFQNFYILTVQETYGKICTLVKDEQAKEMLVDIYVRLYRHVNTLPVDEEELADRIEDEIYRGRSAEVARRQGPEKDHRRTGQNHQHRNLNDRSAEYAIRGRSENFSPESFNRSAIRRSDRTDEIYACSSVRTASKYHNPT